MVAPRRSRSESPQQGSWVPHDEFHSASDDKMTPASSGTEDVFGSLSLSTSTADDNVVGTDVEGIDEAGRALLQSVLCFHPSASNGQKKRAILGLLDNLFAAEAEGTVMKNHKNIVAKLKSVLNQVRLDGDTFSVVLLDQGMFGMFTKECQASVSRKGGRLTIVALSDKGTATERDDPIATAGAAATALFLGGQGVLLDVWAEDVVGCYIDKRAYDYEEVGNNGAAGSSHSGGGGKGAGGVGGSCKLDVIELTCQGDIRARIAVKGENNGIELHSILRSHQALLSSRRADVHASIAQLLDLQETAFDDHNPEHSGMLIELWKCVYQDAFPVPPMTPTPTAAAAAAGGTDQKPERDWGSMGFQRPDCPSSDFRGTGILALHCMLHLARRNAGLVHALAEACRERVAGYPVAAACINVTLMLLGLLRGGGGGSGSSNKSVGHHAVQVKRKDGPGAETAMEGTPLFQFLCRESIGAKVTFETVFATTVLLMEQLWVMHQCTYMDFPRVMAATKKVVTNFLARRPAGLDELERYNLVSVPLPAHRMHGGDN